MYTGKQSIVGIIEKRKEDKGKRGYLRSICSRHQKENHLVIAIDSKNEESMKRLMEEIKKTIRRENRLLEGGVSFQINSNLRKF
jgi:hypothetical protein